MVLEDLHCCTTATIRYRNSSKVTLTDVFNRFNQAICLAHGHMLYTGPVDEIVAHFTLYGPSWKCPLYFNPAEFLLRVSTELPGIESKELEAKVTSAMSRVLSR